MSRPWTTLEIRKLCDLRAGHPHMTLTALGAEIGRSRNAVSRVLSDKKCLAPGSKRRANGQLIAEVRAHLAASTEQYVSAAAVARALRAHRTTVRAAMRRLGVAPNIPARECGVRSVAAARDRNGGDCGGQVSWQDVWAKTAAQGWPPCCSRRMAAVLEAVRLNPGAGRGTIAAAAGTTKLSVGNYLVRAKQIGWLTSARVGRAHAYHLDPLVRIRREGVADREAAVKKLLENRLAAQS